MPKIKNQRYRQFVKSGLIDIISRDEFIGLLTHIKAPRGEGNNANWMAQARAAIILLFYSGRRPCEIVALNAEDIKIDTNLIRIMFKTAKGGRVSLINLPINPITQEVLNLCEGKFPTTRLFYSFLPLGGGRKNTVHWKTIKGETKTKEYRRTSDRLGRYCTKWFDFPCYVFRHNRFSDMAEKGASFLEIAHMKGATDVDSVKPYMHLSSARAKDLVKYLE